MRVCYANLIIVGKGFKDLYVWESCCIHKLKVDREENEYEYNKIIFKYIYVREDNLLFLLEIYRFNFSRNSFGKGNIKLTSPLYRFNFCRNSLSKG